MWRTPLADISATSASAAAASPRPQAPGTGRGTTGGERRRMLDLLEELSARRRPSGLAARVDEPVVRRGRRRRRVGRRIDEEDEEEDDGDQTEEDFFIASKASAPLRFARTAASMSRTNVLVERDRAVVRHGVVYLERRSAPGCGAERAPRAASCTWTFSGGEAGRARRKPRARRPPPPALTAASVVSCVSRLGVHPALTISGSSWRRGRVASPARGDDGD